MNLDADTLFAAVRVSPPQLPEADEAALHAAHRRMVVAVGELAQHRARVRALTVNCHEGKEELQSCVQALQKRERHLRRGFVLTVMEHFQAYGVQLDVDDVTEQLTAVGEDALFKALKGLALAELSGPPENARAAALGVGIGKGIGTGSKVLVTGALLKLTNFLTYDPPLKRVTARAYQHLLSALQLFDPTLVRLPVHVPRYEEFTQGLLFGDVLVIDSGKVKQVRMFKNGALEVAFSSHTTLQEFLALFKLGGL